MILKNLNEWLKLTESINDRNILKAFIFGGGPGSGKSYIIRNLFPSYEVKVLGSDDIFTRYLDNEGISHKLNELPVDILDYVVNTLRVTAKEATQEISSSWLNSLFPIALDGSGKNYRKVIKQKNLLQGLGYDVYFIFINSDLETAKKRNLQRERSLPENVVEELWYEAIENRNKYRQDFGKNFYEIQNSKEASSKKEIEIYRLGKHLLESPLENPIGQDLISDLKEKGLKYRFDLDKNKYTIPI